MILYAQDFEACCPNLTSVGAEDWAQVSDADVPCLHDWGVSVLEEFSTVWVKTQEENNCKLVPDVTWTPPFADFNLDPFTIIKL